MQHSESHRNLCFYIKLIWISNHLCPPTEKRIPLFFKIGYTISRTIAKKQKEKMTESLEKFQCLTRRTLLMPRIHCCSWKGLKGPGWQLEVGSFLWPFLIQLHGIDKSVAIAELHFPFCSVLGLSPPSSANLPCASHSTLTSLFSCSCG